MNNAPAAAEAPLSAGAPLWRETVESYELERHHLELLERACRSLDHAIEAEEVIRRDGLVVDGRVRCQAHLLS